MSIIVSINYFFGYLCTYSFCYAQYYFFPTARGAIPVVWSGRRLPTVRLFRRFSRSCCCASVIIRTMSADGRTLSFPLHARPWRQSDDKNDERRRSDLNRQLLAETVLLRCVIRNMFETVAVPGCATSALLWCLSLTTRRQDVDGRMPRRQYEIEDRKMRRCGWGDLNSRPQDYESCALTRLSYTHVVLCVSGLSGPLKR